WLHRDVRPLTAADRDSQSSLLDRSSDSGEGTPAGGEGRSVHLLVDALDSETAAESRMEDEEEIADQMAAYSAREVLRRRDFSQLDPAEIAEVRRLIAELRWHAPTRQLRRTKRAAKGPHADPRRAFRESLATGGEILRVPRRTRRRKPRPLVLICDISGSMERYTSLLLRFLHALRQGRGAVETFVFGTRLTRITRQLRVRDTDAALAEVASEVVDWGGGTRIGDSLATFNRVWGRRVLGHGATVVIISDGWDRGEPEVLAPEMAHLQRLSHRLVWLNPLLGLAGYEPLTRGMRAALPYVDNFLSSHNLASLEQLGRFLRDLDDQRPERGHRVPVLSAS
ncbi:MAG TPA: VWA domain-containing protein, partial [Chloroflexota bacterium]|nr:VWA domain-containing protein [Chloroflexota bacterium]